MGARVKRIGHGGASALVRANTLASFDAAAELGVDMIEFDVRGRGGALLLAHTLAHTRALRCVRLEAALDHLRAPRFASIELNLDLKDPGIEAAVIDALRTRGMLGRALLSSQIPTVVDRVRALEPGVATGVSVGGRLARRSCRWRDWRAEVLEGLRARRWDALMAQHRLVDAALVEDVVARGGHIHAWTVNERAAIERLGALGVSGIATADPRLFWQPA